MWRSPPRQMRGFVRGCGGRTVSRARDLLPTPAYAIPSGLPATAWYFRTDAAPPPRRSPATFLAPQNDPQAIANAPAPLHRRRCHSFWGRAVRAPSTQTRAAGKSARSPWLPLPFQMQPPPHHPRNPLPILGLHRKLLLAPRGDRVIFGLAIVVK